MNIAQTTMLASGTATCFCADPYRTTTYTLAPDSVVIANGGIWASSGFSGPDLIRRLVNKAFKASADQCPAWERRRHEHMIKLDQTSAHVWTRFAMQCPSGKHQDAPFDASASISEWTQAQQAGQFLTICPASLLAIAASNSKLHCEDGRVTLGDAAKSKSLDKDASRPCECMLQSVNNTSITWDMGDGKAVCGIISVQTGQDSSDHTEIYIQDDLGRHMTPRDWLDSYGTKSS